MVKNLPAKKEKKKKRIYLQCRRHGFNPQVGKIPWRREWQPTPVFLPGESHGQRRLEGYSPWGCKELDMTERLCNSIPQKLIHYSLPRLQIRKLRPRSTQ